MPQFDHERLKVYQQSIRFVEFATSVLDEAHRSRSVHTQLDRASTSIPLNIAEGNGKHTSSDRCRFFDIARGSALECAACLGVLLTKEAIGREKAQKGKELLLEIVSMLVGLIRANSSERRV